MRAWRYTPTDDRGQRVVLRPTPDLAAMRVVREAMDRLDHRFGKGGKQDRSLRPTIKEQVAGVVAFALLLGSLVMGAYVTPRPLGLGLAAVSCVAGVATFIFGQRRAHAAYQQRLRSEIARAGRCPACYFTLLRVPGQQPPDDGALCTECGAWWRVSERRGDRLADGSETVAS